VNTLTALSRNLTRRFLPALVTIIGFFSPIAALAQIKIWVPPVTTEVWHEGTTERVWQPPPMGTCHVPEVGHFEPRQVDTVVHHPATTRTVHHPATTTVVHHPATNTVVHHPATTETIHHSEVVGVRHVERQTHIEHHPAETHTVQEEGYYDSYYVEYYSTVCDVYCTWYWDEYTEGGWEECWEENCREEAIGGGWVEEWVEGNAYTVTSDAWVEEVVDVEEHDEYYTIPAWNEEVTVPAWDETVDVPAWDETVNVPAWDEIVVVSAWDETVVTTVQIWIVDVPAHDIPCPIGEGQFVDVGHEGWWETILVAVGHWRDITPQVEVVSRDKFLAGSFIMPQEVSDVEIEIASATENMGRYSGLLGGGTTKVYASIPEILSDADINSGTTPREVWFVRDSVNPRKINFYTCFNAIGNVQIRLIRGNQQAVTQHPLYAAQDFADWIDYVDGWVKGVGFSGGGTIGGSIPMSFTFGYAAAPSSGGSSNFTSGAIHVLTRVPLIPIFNVIAQTQGMEAFALGMFEGAKAGLKDDKEMAEMIIGGYLQTNDWMASQAANEIVDWQTNPLRRSRELMAMCVRVCEHAIFAPLSAASQAYSTWDKFKNGSWTMWGLIKGSTVKQYLVPVGLAYNLAGGIVSWAEDFGNRMIAGAEKTTFQATPWHTSELASDLIGFGRTMAYSGGYYLGYLGEQVAMGTATGGVAKVGAVVMKGGAIWATQLAKKTAFTVATRSAVFKQSLRSTVVSAELRAAIERGLTESGKRKIEQALGVETSVAEFVESHLARNIANCNIANLQKIVEHAVTMPNTRRLFLQPGGEGVLLDRLALFIHAIGNSGNDQAILNFLKIFEQRLVFQEGQATVEWTADFLRCFKGNPAEFVNRGPFQSFDADQVARLKNLCDSPNAGWIWKLDEEPPQGFWLRGIVGELDLYYREYRSFSHLPTAGAVDFIRPPLAVQLKTTNSGSASTIERLKGAMSRLSQYSNSECTDRLLDVRKRPGVDTTALEAELRAHGETLTPVVRVSVREYNLLSPGQ